MADKLDITRSFMESVSAGAPKAELLADNAVFRALNFNIPGKAAVLERLTGENTSKVYKSVTWGAPAADKFDGIQIKGTPASGAPAPSSPESLEPPTLADQLPHRAYGDHRERGNRRSEEHTSELQSLRDKSYAVF